MVSMMSVSENSCRPLPFMSTNSLRKFIQKSGSSFTTKIKGKYRWLAVLLPAFLLFF